LDALRQTLASDSKLRARLEVEKQDLAERFERQREMMKDQARELIDLQSQAADAEDKLTTTEQKLIQVKLNWAHSELQREQLYNQCQE